MYLQNILKDLNHNLLLIVFLHLDYYEMYPAMTNKYVSNLILRFLLDAPLCRTRDLVHQAEFGNQFYQRGYCQKPVFVGKDQETRSGVPHDFVLIGFFRSLFENI